MMSTTEIILFVINVGLGGISWLLKSTHADIKEQLKAHQVTLDIVRDTYMKKDDFREFRTELWRRLDRIDAQLHGTGVKE